MLQPEPPQLLPQSAPQVAGPAVLRDIAAYWHSLRQAQAVPARADICPRQIGAALPHAFILQRVAPHVARFRMAGQVLYDLMQMDPRAMPISALFSHNSHAALAALVEAAFVRPARVAVALQSPAQMARGPMTAQMVLLPLRDAQGQISRLLGAIVVDGVAGPRPRRFDLAPDAAVQIVPLDASPAKATGLGVARPALRLVVNNG